MEQSIASSRGDISSGKRVFDSWKSLSARLWPSIKSNFGLLTRQSGLVLRSNISRPLDIEKICTQLRIEARAEAEGSEDQPPSIEVELQGTQREIVAYFRELQKKAQGRISSTSRKLRKLGDEIDVPHVSSRLHDIPSQCENAVFRLVAESQAQLNILDERETQYRKRYAALVENRDQNSAPERPLSSLFVYAFLTFLVGMGAFAIAKVSIAQFGAESIVPPMWTVAISLFVVVTSAVVSLALSQLISRVSRPSGFLAIATGVGLLGIVALLAAEFIAAVTINPEVTVRSVAGAILADPIASVRDFSAWSGFAISLAAGLLAFLVSYRPDKSRPGYGISQSGIHRIRNKRNRLTRRLRVQINAIIDAADARVSELPKRLKAQLSRYSRRVDESTSIPSSLGDYELALEVGCSILLDRYRVINTRARKSDAPMSFSERVCFTSERVPSIAMLDQEVTRLQKFRQAVADLDGEAAEVRHKLRDLNSRALSSLEDMPAAI